MSPLPRDGVCGTIFTKREQMTEVNPPDPGSVDALDIGCTCPVLDNHYGKSLGDPPLFWINGSCPIHALVSEDQ